MLGVFVSVPVACFRKGLAREFLETEPLPPPSTCYGFILSLVGEEKRSRHIGARITATLLNQPCVSVVLRTIWRLKKLPLGSSGNTRPDYQQVLTGTELVLWLDSSQEESQGPNLEERVRSALEGKGRNVSRYGGLSLGESTHLVNDVSLLSETLRLSLEERFCSSDKFPRTYVLAEQGLIGLPVWVDHVGSAGTVYVVGELEESSSLIPPLLERMPRITPPVV